MKFDHPEIKVSYSVPDTPTVRQILRYDGAIAAMRGADMYIRLWQAVPELVTDWSAPVKLDCPLDDVADMQHIDIIKLVALEVFSWRKALDEIEKN